MDTPITNMPVTYAPLIFFKKRRKVFGISPRELQNVKNLGYIRSYNMNNYYYVGICITQEVFIYMVTAIGKINQSKFSRFWPPVA